jgi:hypothetical protein
MWTQLLARPKDEAEAMQVALTGSAFDRARLALGAGLALSLDPSDTRQVFHRGRSRAPAAPGSAARSESERR